MKRIFVSHQETDKKVADILVSFLIRNGISYDDIFCSSLPGINVEFTIFDEVKKALETSNLNFVILSQAYYESSFCQNEAGIIWFLDVPKVLICLSDIVNEKSLKGFLNSNHIMRRLGNKSDLEFICDQLKKIFLINISTSQINNNISNTVCEYNFLSKLKKDPLDIFFPKPKKH